MNFLWIKSSLTTFLLAPVGYKRGESSLNVRRGCKRVGDSREEITELSQQRRRRLRKRHLKSEFARVLQTFPRLFHLVQFVKCWQMFLLELNSKRLYQSSGKEKESRCLLFMSSTKDEKMFHVVVGQWRLRNEKKSVQHVQSCCFANLNQLLLLFFLLPFLLPSPVLKLPIILIICRLSRLF